MNYFKILSLAAVLVFFVSCKNEYKKYTKKPDYITNATGKHKTYFDAYDETLKQWDVDYEELYITTSHGIAHVIVSGGRNAPPLVLLHGMNASSTMWYPNAKALAKDYRIFAIDLLTEPGKSYKTSDFNNIEDITSWFQEVLWALKLDSFHLLGASRGGWLAMDIALRHQNNIKSIVLLSPAQTFTWIRPSRNLLKNIISAFSSEEEQMKSSLATLSSNAGNIDKSYLKQYKVGVKNDSLPKFMMQMTPFSKKDFQSLKMPVFLLIGDNDMINNEKSIRLAKNEIAKGKAEIVYNAGHFLSIDQADTVNKKVIDFLKSVDNDD
ncbi:putative hydrolase or acyltransferase of alpha/beta superfamily [Aequorivita sublithincola DSM 14238]|uniref:Putative hydrolase or acyltransferase of alpha/beta superfamily n=1 Tax=Aequorivita sublithincola (strain DSM 14238 / LMG 21431 / ACAM 643 / 9-3) TaxID=746697 RepID=I3YWR4_AEQSU|nr:alpha/beta hydrolase [Aequorivita sublithincola]AFL81432.1 putative hydrolase or acyltransferase of alpha/beta superfamily [Aequorivita sublithincola DSM 14238]